MWIYDARNRGRTAGEMIHSTHWAAYRSDKTGNSEIREKVKVHDATVEITAYRERSTETV
jgi:hypothetical protein